MKIKNFLILLFFIKSENILVYTEVSTSATSQSSSVITLTFSSFNNFSSLTSSSLVSTSTILDSLVSTSTILDSLASTSTTSDSLASTSKISDSGQKIEEIIPLLGPKTKSDVVFIISRNEGFGRKQFYSSLTMCRDILMRLSIVHPNFTRVAFITHSENVTVDYNDISNGTSLNKCQMFPSINSTKLPWDTITYRADNDKGTNLVGAFKEAKNILNKDKDRKKIIIVIDIQAPTKNLENKLLDGINIFGIKVGNIEIDAYFDKLFKKRWDREDNWKKMLDNVKNFNRELVNDTWNGYCEMIPFREISKNYNTLKQINNNSYCYCDLNFGLVRRTCMNGFILKIEDSALVCEKLMQENEKCLNCSQDCQLYPHCDDCTSGGNRLLVKSRNYCSFYCRDNTFGQNCDIELNICRFPNLCDNGECEKQSSSDFSCNCHKFYKGTFCDEIEKTTIIQTQTVVVPGDPSPLNITAAVISSAVIGGLIFIFVLIGIILCILVQYKKKRINKKNAKSGVAIGTGTETNSHSVRSLKNTARSNLINNFWKSDNLRSSKTSDGMPSVPWRSSTQLTSEEMQSKDEEELFYKNEVIQDNRTSMENWKKYLTELVSKGTIDKGMMVNMMAREPLYTKNWVFSWGEAHELSLCLGSECSLSVQNTLFDIKTSDDGISYGQSRVNSLGEKKAIAFGKSNKYLIVGIVTESDEESFSTCRNEIKSITNHVKAQGF